MAENGRIIRRIYCSDDEEDEAINSGEIQALMNPPENPTPMLPVDVLLAEMSNRSSGNKKRTRKPANGRKRAVYRSSDDDDDDNYDDGDEDYEEEDEGGDGEDDEEEWGRSSGKHKSRTKSSSGKSSTKSPKQAAEDMTASKSTRSSSRRSTGSGVKEARRLEALRELQGRMGKGLAGVPSDDEYDTEDEGGGNGDDDDDDDDDDARRKKKKRVPREHDDKFTFSAARHKSGSGGSRGHSVQSFFKTGDRPRKAPSPEPSSGEDDGVDNFILDSDEEREEEEERLRSIEKQRTREKKQRRKEKEARRLEREQSGEPAKRKMSLEPAPATSVKKKRVIVDDEDEEEVQLVGTSSGLRRRRITPLEGDDDDDDEENGQGGGGQDDMEDSGEDDDDEDDDDEDEDEDGDDGPIDGPMLYWQVDAMRDRNSHSEVMPVRKSFSRSEAVRLYIEMMAHAHVDSKFLTKLAANPAVAPNCNYLAAARQVENLVCTTRESLVGSGAWNVTFTSELHCRPFYICAPSFFGHGEEQKCSACNRTSMSSCKMIYLFGQKYDGRKAWNSSRWDRELPAAAFLHSTFKEPSAGGASSSSGADGDRRDRDDVVELSGSDEEDEARDLNGGDDGASDCSSDEADERAKASKVCQWWKKKWPGELTRGRESRWILTGHCCQRTQLYHTLLHYKLRLFLKVREKLERCAGSVGEAMRDATFISAEADRYESLLGTASQLYGGRGMESHAAADLWRDSETVAQDEPARRGSSARQAAYDEHDGSAGGGAGGGILTWLQKSQENEEQD